MPTSFSYHQSTSYDRHFMEPHVLDWQNQPLPYKIYPGIQPIHLPEIRDLYPGTLSQVAGFEDIASSEKTLVLEDLSTILYLGNGLTGKIRQGTGDFYFRSAPSAGALYPNEIYLVWPGSDDLPSGVFHCGVHNRSLTPLRQGNFVPIIRDSVKTGASDPVAVFVITGVYFRSGWKYRRRAYRYVLLDAGHVVESLRLVIRAAGNTCRLAYAFDDPSVNHLLGLDPEKEVSFGFIHVYGKGKETASPNILPIIPPSISVDPLPKSIREASKTSDNEIRYKEILDIHQAGIGNSGLTGPAADMFTCLGVSYASFRPIHYPNGLNDGETLEKTILPYSKTVYSRRSHRNFIPHPMRHSQLTFLLDLICRTSDDSDPAYSSAVAVGLLTANVAGMPPGFHLIDVRQRRLHRVFERQVTDEMAAVCLDQKWLAHAGVYFLFMTNLDVLDRQWGPRGYRYAMITAGRLGHVVYLGSTALGLGSCGIGALYDADAQRLLGLNSVSVLVYVVAAGSVKKKL
ncbi:MAG: SagB/ThcOx family dehydrogenase [Desulfatirhabdiaceae bacterium]